LSLDSAKEVSTLLMFLVAYCIQPLLVDVIKYNGGAHSSTFLFLLPHYYAMMLVGFIPTEKSIWECDWRKGIVVSACDIVNQALKKVGLIFSGAAVYIVVDSSSIVWTAIWSWILLRRRLVFMQWVAIFFISAGVALKAATLHIALTDYEFIGVLLILTASILMGLTFVLNEKFMKDDNPIPGPNLVCMMGVCCSAVLTAWTFGWTVPQFDTLVIDNIKRKNGSVMQILVCFAALLAASWIHAGTLWYLVKHMGAVSSGVLKGLKVACVFLLSHLFFCERDPHQCLNLWTGSSAFVCVCGVVLYSYTTSQLKHKHQQQIEASKPLMRSQTSTDSITRNMRMEERDMVNMQSSMIITDVPEPEPQHPAVSGSSNAQPN